MRALVGAVVAKELVDHLRDRRSLLSALLFPALGPLLFGVMFGVMASWFSQDRPLELPVVGRAHSESLPAFLERHGARLSEAPADYERRVQEGTLDAVLVIPADFAADFAAGRTAAVQLLVDHSRNQARGTVRRVHRLLGAYAGQLAGQRLLARGVAPALAAPVRVDEVDLATPERTAATLLNIIPFFMVLAAFVGGMNVAIDTTAGERERGSLEPLLLNPVARGALVAGKWLTCALLACVGLGVCLGGFAGVVRLVPLEDLGVKVRLDAAALGAMFAAVAPLALFAASAQMLVATFARSFKEAQVYLQAVLLLPMVPGLALTLSPLEGRPWMYAVPVLAQDLMLADVMRGDPPGLPTFALATAACLLATAACLALTTRLLGQERIVFGR